MGVGASLAGGCTTGGFFNPVLHASPAGWAVWVGLLAGAAWGFKRAGWPWALAHSGGLLLLRYALVRQNESTDKFTLMGADRAEGPPCFVDENRC